MIVLDDIVEIQTVPSREWMALCQWMVESVLPNYWETIAGILPDSSTWSGGLGLCRGALNRSAWQPGHCVNFSVTRVLINNPWPWPWPWPCIILKWKKDTCPKCHDAHSPTKKLSTHCCIDVAILSRPRCRLPWSMCECCLWGILINDKNDQCNTGFAITATSYFVQRNVKRRRSWGTRH